MKSYDCSETNFILLDSQKLDAYIEDAKTARRKSIKLPNWEQLWNSALEFFTRSPEPKIYEKRDGAGNLYFQVYDPIAHQSSTFSTEQEVRIWLDQRYYQ